MFSHNYDFKTKATVYNFRSTFTTIFIDQSIIIIKKITIFNYESHYIQIIQ